MIFKVKNYFKFSVWQKRLIIKKFKHFYVELFEFKINFVTETKQGISDIYFKRIKLHLYTKTILYVYKQQMLDS